MFLGKLSISSIRERKLNLLLLIIWVVVFLSYSYLAFAVPHRTSFLSPDENNTYCVAKQIRTKKTVYIDSPLNEMLDMKIFRGRLFVEARKNKYTAFNSLGLSFLVAAGMYVNLTFFVVPILSSLAVIGIYLITRAIAGKRAGLLAALLYGLLPTNVFNSNQLLDAAPSFSLFLFSLGCILFTMEKESIALALASGLSLGLAFFIRQANSIYIAALLVLLIHFRKRLGLRQWAAFAIPSGLIALSTIIMNRLVYGSFFRSGILTAEGIKVSRTLFPKLDISALAHSMSNHLIAYIPLLFALGICGCLFAYREKRDPVSRPLNLFMIAMASLAVLINSSRTGTWSFHVYSITSSMARYYIPLYAVVIIYASFCIDRLARNNTSLLPIFIFTAVLSTYAIFCFGNLEYMNLQKLAKRAKVYGSAKASLLEGHPQPIVVFTKRFDKDLYDDVQVGLCYTEEDARKKPDIRVLFPLVDMERDVLPAVDRLMAEGYLVAVARDCYELIRILNENGYSTISMKEYKSLFMVTRNDPT